MKSMRVTVAVFSKNEDKTISGIVDNILKSFRNSEIVLVVGEISETIAEIGKNKGVRIIRDTGKGKGAAVRQAINAINSDILVLVDADGSHKIEDIPRIIEPITQGKADMAIASRFKGGSEEFSGNINNRLHLAGNYLSSFFIQLIWGDFRHGFIDCQNGFRAIRRDALKNLALEADGFSIEQEMVIKCLKKGYRIADVPSYEYRRQYGKSNIEYSKSLPEYIWCILRNIFTS